VRHLANGVFLDWDTSNTTVQDNWICNAGGQAVKIIWDNWNIVNSGNHASSAVITPPFVAEVGPGGTAHVNWNMQQGSRNGFAVELGSHQFAVEKTATVTLSTAGANGDVIADSVAFVKIEDGTVRRR
jgi:hypothetical protein